MNSPEGLMSNPTEERCQFCNASILVASVENELVPVNAYGEPFCNSACVEAHAENQNERAYESFLSDFYGGGAPVTMEEKYQAAAEEKRRLQ